MLFEISPKCFMPAPEVTSAVVAMDVRKEPPVELTDEKRFFSVVKAAFQQRRKTLSNALKNTAWPKNRSPRSWKRLVSTASAAVKPCRSKNLLTLPTIG